MHLEVAVGDHALPLPRLKLLEHVGEHVHWMFLFIRGGCNEEFLPSAF